MAPASIQRWAIAAGLGLALAWPAAGATPTPTPTPAAARAALEKAGGVFRDRLGLHGTYVWAYSTDGRHRRGEGGEAPPGRGWVQPPGTPAVGAAFLQIFEATGDPGWLAAAREVAGALVATQLLSGGWYYSIATDPKDIEGWCYRSRDIGAKACRRLKDNRDRNRTVLDDDTTQAALTFLMMFDAASEGADASVRASIDFGLERLAKLQYPNGGFFPYLEEKAPGAGVETPARSSLPAQWSRRWVKPAGGPYFVVNDNLPRDMGRLFLAAYRLYGNPAYRRAAVKVGDFLLASQLPPPQPGWCQQYDRVLQPVWGRRFEPPAVASFETAGSLDYLIELARETGDARYLDGAKAAGAWLAAARLPDGSWARYYELSSDRPLYVDNRERLTFDDRDLLDHYGMKGDFGIEATLRRLDRASAGTPSAPPPLWASAADALGADELAARSRTLIERLDSEGRWVEGGWIDGQRFVDAVFILSRFLGASHDPDP